jgi:mannose-1-phosphate guanylyltransferase
MQLVVIAGGTGSRLWPVSREYFPKQFVSLVSENSMLQDTINMHPNGVSESTYVICNESTRFLVAQELQELKIENPTIILEPISRNTAPAIALAAFDLIKKGTDPVMLVVPSDHNIKNKEKFNKAVKQAQILAESEFLVTFGVVPTHPETGYGYIKKGSKLENGFNIDAFIEKPNQESARKYINSGEYLWNSGIFAFKASTYLSELKKYSPKVYAHCESALDGYVKDIDFVRVDESFFKNCENISIDYAVMEKTKKSVVVPLDAGWSDLGSWNSIFDLSDKDQQGNVRIGDIFSINCSNNYLRSESRLVATLGIDDLIIVETKDAVLVANKNDSQRVKDLVDHLRQAKRPEFKFHCVVHRPWGKYETIESGNRYQVKRITVKPGAKLSLQKHHHRAEHWVVVSGSAKVIVGKEEKFLSENQSTFIPIGEVHSLENPGKIQLELIEIQSGAYLGEDDIIRFEDLYGRV